MDSTTNPTDVLSDEWKKNFSTLFRNTPIIGLPSSGMVRSTMHPQSVQDVFEVVAHLVGAYKIALNRQDATVDELMALKRDLTAAGRVLKLMTDDQA